MDPRRAIPGIDRLLGDPAFAPLLAEAPRDQVVAALQHIQGALRESMAQGAAPVTTLADPAWYAARAREELHAWSAPSLRPVINATGVVLHTNLGRAPIAPVALAAIRTVAGGYSNLEYDLGTGERGSRYDHCVALLQRLTGAEDALVVNNNAAALLLALNTIALGRNVIISRGELVEIGGAFRVPDILARSGANMLEVGSTNRTHERDYAAAIDAHTALLLKVHRSNFQVSGFVAEVSVAALATLAHQHELPVVHDLGSGLLLPADVPGLPPEPRPHDSLAAGCDLVAVSGDKLMGGPQAGILLGRASLIDACRRNPLCRALRVDKLTIAALSATLALYLDPARAQREIPALRMLGTPLSELTQRAQELAAELTAAGATADVIAGESRVGGGALPDATLPTRLVRVTARAATALERALRAGDPAVVARIQDDTVLLDVRTIAPGEVPALVRALTNALLA